MRIAVIGSGYVATVTAVAFAGMGHSVIGAGTEAEWTEELAKGNLPFFEEGLQAQLNTELNRDRLRFTLDVKEAVRTSDIVYICVAAPPLPNGNPDKKALHQLIRELESPDVSVEGKLFVASSTLPVEMSQWIGDTLQKAHPNEAMDMACVPHFMREGSALHDFNHPERIIIGAESARAKELLVALYTPLGSPIFMTDMVNAELIKLATNAFLALKISFINSMAQLCEKVNGDVTQVAKGLGMDSRISAEFLSAGLGYGGVFLPRDVQSLIATAASYSQSFDVLKATDVVNRYQRISFMDRMSKAAHGSLEGKTIAIWGLAYRPNTDDMREAPSVQIVWGLQNRGAHIRAYDPLAMESAKTKLRNVTYTASAYEAAQGADIIAILTEWDEFKTIDFKRLQESSPCRTIVDGRNLYHPKRMEELGYHYVSIGRPEAKQPTAAV
jgi:UDPglucose 6-dehydrogenase